MMIVLLLGVVILLGWLDARAGVEEDEFVDEFPFEDTLREEDLPIIGDEIAVDMGDDLIWCRVLMTTFTREGDEIVGCTALVNPEDGQDDLYVVFDGYAGGVPVPIWVPAEEE